jgi:hypothetical protein
MLIFSNNASSTTAGTITNTATSVNLAAGTGVLFPQPVGNQEFIATFIDQLTGTLREIVHVTNMNGDTATIVRAQEDTNALEWPAGSIFVHLHTAGAMQEFLQIDQVPDTSIIYIGQDTGIVNNVTVPTISPPATVLVPFMQFNIAIANTNTGQSVAQIAGFPVYPIFRADGTVLQANDITQGQNAELVFTGTTYQLVNYKQQPPINTSLLFPFGYWAGIIGGTPTQYNFNIPAPVTYPYQAGVLVSGLISQLNTGSLNATINGGTAVPLLFQTGAPFEGGEFTVIHTMINAMSDGVNLRVLGTLGGIGVDSTAPPGGGSGGGTPPPNTGIFRYGDGESGYLTIASQANQTLPTPNFVSTFNIMQQNTSAYPGFWQSIGIFLINWQSPTDVLTCELFQNVQPPFTTFGDEGSIYITVTPTTAGFVDTFTRTNMNMSDYGPFWGQLVRLPIPALGGATNINVGIFTRINAGSFATSSYGGIGSIYVDMSRGAYGDDVLSNYDTRYWTSFFNTTGGDSGSVPGGGGGSGTNGAMLMSDYGGTWLRIATISYYESSLPNIADIYQRVL